MKARNIHFTDRNDWFRDRETGEEWLSYSPAGNGGWWFRFVIIKDKAPDFLKFINSDPQVLECLGELADRFANFLATSHK